MPRYRDREGRLHSSAESRIDRTGSGGGGGGAPTNATYLTLTFDGTLTAERVLTPSDGLFAIDAGANGAYTIRVSDLYHPFLLMGG